MPWKMMHWNRNIRATVLAQKIRCGRLGNNSWNDCASSKIMKIAVVECQKLFRFGFSVFGFSTLPLLIWVRASFIFGLFLFKTVLKISAQAWRKHRVLISFIRKSKYWKAHYAINSCGETDFCIIIFGLLLDRLSMVNRTFNHAWLLYACYRAEFQELLFYQQSFDSVGNAGKMD